jgi:hypothetical protein
VGIVLTAIPQLRTPNALFSNAHARDQSDRLPAGAILARMQTPDTNPADPIWTRARAMFARAVRVIGDAAAIASLQLLPRSLRRDIVGWIALLEHVVRKLLLAEAAVLHRLERERARRRVRVELVPLRGMAMHWHPQAQRTPSPSGEGAGGGVNRDGRATAQRGPRAIANSSARSHPSSLHPTPSSPPLAGRGSASSAPPRPIDLARPETWRAYFSFALPRRRYLPDSRAPRIRDLWGPDAPPPPEPERAPRIFRPEDSPFRLARRFEALRRVLENPAPHAERLARALAREAQRQSQLVQRYLFAPACTNHYDPADHRLGLDATGLAFDAPQAFDSS